MKSYEETKYKNEIKRNKLVKIQFLTKEIEKSKDYPMGGVRTGFKFEFRKKHGLL